MQNISILISHPFFNRLLGPTVFFPNFVPCPIGIIKLFIGENILELKYIWKMQNRYYLYLFM